MSYTERIKTKVGLDEQCVIAALREAGYDIPHNALAKKDGLGRWIFTWFREKKRDIGTEG